jgi:hypothetical protein
MEEIFDVQQDLAPVYREPEVSVSSGVTFDIDYYRSHFLPIREVIELKKAKATDE